MDVVTGAAGHIGNNIVRALIDAGRPVRALVYRDTRAFAGLEVETVPADLQAPDSLVAAFQGADTVYHLAAVVSLLGTAAVRQMEMNVLGVRRVVDACLQAGVRRLVHFSSVHAFSQRPLGQPLDESRPPAHGPGTHAYDRSKALGENEIRFGIERGLDAVIVNPTGVIGPFDFKPSPMGRFFLDLHRRRLPALVGGGFNWVDVRDVAAGAIAAAERGRTGARYILGGHWASVRELSDLVARVIGVAVPRVVVPRLLAATAAPFAEGFAMLTRRDPLFTSYSVASLGSNRQINYGQAVRELGFHSRPLRETVTDLYAWFDRAGMLTAP